MNGLLQNSSGGLLWQTPEADPSAAGPSSSGQDGGLPNLPLIVESCGARSLNQIFFTYSSFKNL